MDEITSVFIQEAREQLAEMESGLLRFEQTPDDADNINAIFRAAHTVKGGAGVVECDFIVDFTHLVENLLDALRNGDLAVSPQLATVLLGCCDHMGRLIDVLPHWRPHNEIVYAVFPSRRGLLPSIRALLDHLSDGCRPHRP